MQMKATGKSENLIPFDMMSRERHRELSRRGGIASGITRRRRAKIKEKLKLLLLAQALQEEAAAELAAELTELQRRYEGSTKRE